MSYHRTPARPLFIRAAAPPPPYVVGPRPPPPTIYVTMPNHAPRPVTNFPMGDSGDGLGALVVL